ncbi:MAG: anti-sigma factor [Egibacteraceae bacterium]
MRGCQDARVHLGAYVLDGLSPVERAQVEAHTRACHACRSELADLAPLPGLLALVEEAPPAPPPELRARVLAGAPRRRLAPRRVLALVAAALVAGIALGMVATALLPPRAPEPAVVLDLLPGEGFQTTGSASFTTTREGLRVELALTDLPPLPEGAIYEAWLSAPDTDGPISMGRVEPTPDGRATFTWFAPGALDEYSGVWVTAEPDATDPAHDGPTVAAAQLPGHGKGQDD